MAKRTKSDDAVEVKAIPPRKGVRTGKPGKIVTSAMRMKTAMGLPTAGTMMGVGGNYYSPELSTDFLELPQSRDEQRNFYRFFYDYEPFVGQAIDQHTELPLSKLRLRMPVAKNRELAEKSMRFCERWAKKIKLLQKLMRITHEYHLMGEANIFCEDTNEEMPDEVRAQLIREIKEDGTLVERWDEYEDADERAVAWLKKNYKGWTAVRVLPPEQVKVESFPFTDEKLVELVPDAKSKAIVERARGGDPNAERIVNSMPTDIVQAILEGRNPVLNTDKDAGSFVYTLERKRSDYEPHGKSILQRCFLPGTPIWVSRGGVPQEVPVEDVQNGEMVLTHNGRFRSCQVGSRSVDEEITVIDVEGIQDPLRLTSEHRVMRIAEDGTEEWVEARHMRVGDLVREAHIAPESDDVPSVVDLVEWWQGRQLLSTKRGRPKLGLSETDRQLQVLSSTADSELTVCFEYLSDNRNHLRATEGLTRLLQWAHKLTAPVVKTQSEVALEAGVSARDVRVYAPRLRKEGLLKTEAVSLGRGKQVTWYPSTTSELPSVQTTITSPVSSINVTEEFCYLLGTWLGDGSIWTEKETLLNVHSLKWSLHDEGMRERIRGLIKECFPGVDIITGSLMSKKGHQGDVRVEDPLLARWFLEEFGHGFDGKHLPEWVFNLPVLMLRALLQGVVDTDGWVKKDGTTLTIDLRNKVLVQQLHLLANRVGFHTQVRKTIQRPHVWKRKWENQQGAQEKTYSYEERECWKVECCRSDDIRAWTEGGLKTPTLSVPQQKYTWCSRFKGGHLTRKVRDVRIRPYQGVVYSFGVVGDESHITGGITTHNCMRTLVFRDKVRQSLTSIASRHMTPYRLVYAEDMNEEQTEALREQVDLALQDPDYSIVTNFQVNWEEMGADQRLPDWSWVWDNTNQQLYAGLGVTEALLSGESSYSGDRISLEVINSRYMFLREVLQDLVEENFFEPMCRRMGFVEEDEDGNMQVIVPGLSFTRLALRDTADTFDALFNLYQKGSLDIDVILDLMNIDPVTTQEKLKRDLFTLNDATFNELLRGVYGKAGDLLVDGTTIMEKIAENLGLKYVKPKDDAGRF